MDWRKLLTSLNVFAYACMRLERESMDILLLVDKSSNARCSLSDSVALPRRLVRIIDTSLGLPCNTALIVWTFGAGVMLDVFEDSG